jgi:hypothetical protein
MIYILMPLLIYFKKDGIKYHLFITAVVNDAVDDLICEFNEIAKIQFNKNYPIIIIRYYVLTTENKVY